MQVSNISNKPVFLQPQVHQALKLKAIHHQTTLQDYVNTVLNNHIKKKGTLCQTLKVYYKEQTKP